MYSRRFDLDGAPLGEPSLLVDDDEGLFNQAGPAREVEALADGSGYVVSFTQRSGQDYLSSRFLTVDMNGELVGAPTTIDTYVGQGSESAARQRLSSPSRVELLEDDGFIFAWSKSEVSFPVQFGPYGVNVQFFDADGTARGENLNLVSNTETTSAALLDIFVDGDGGFTIIYLTGERLNRFAEPSTEVLTVRSFDAAGVAMGPAVAVDSISFLPTTKYDIAQLSDGAVVVTKIFRSDAADGPQDVILTAQIFDPSGATLVPAYQVARLPVLTDDFDSIFNTQILSLVDGDFLVAYTRLSEGANEQDIIARLYAADGVPVGEEFVINSDTAGAQILTDLIALPDGRVMVVWSEGSGIEFRLLEPFSPTPTPGDDTLTGTPANDTIDGLAGDDTIYGFAGDDALTGNAGFDTLIGGAGDDTLDGGANPEGSNGQGDIMLGGVGDDTYHVDSGLDLVDEGSYFPAYGFGGTDTIVSTADFYWDVASVGEILIISEDVVDAGGDGVTIVGSVFSNQMIGHSGTDILFGRGGSDIYRSGDGVDYISLSKLGLTDDNAYAGVDGVNTVIVERRTTGAFSYDIVFEFEAGRDRLDVSDYGFASAEAAFATGVDDGLGSSYFILGDGLDYLYMAGLTLDEMSAGDFIV